VRAIRPVLLAMAFAVSALSAPGAGPGLSLGAGAGLWRPLIEALAARGAIEARFTERRYFSFRREPTVLKGVIRVSDDRGVSLGYTDPEVTTVIVDSAGLIVRDRKGRDREMAAGSKEAGAVVSLLPILRFDADTLDSLFDTQVSMEGSGWKLEFTPRDPRAARTLGSITVWGTLTEVARIEFRRSASQRIEIEVGETRTGVVFSAAELSRYFRRPAPR